MELTRLDRDPDAIQEPLGDKLAVLPSWVRGQLANVAGLLQDRTERVKTHLRRLGVGFVVAPVSGEGRPFLRATGTASVLKAIFGQQVDLSATGRSRPRSAP